MMLKPRQVFALLMLAAALLALGCIRKTITDHRIIDSIQAFLDAPPDESDEWALTPEERAAIQSFETYRNKIKVQLVENTEELYWEPVGKKMVRAFVMACRELSMFEANYIAELRIMAVLDNKRDNFLVGEVRFNNASERIYPNIYNPSRRRR